MTPTDMLKQTVAAHLDALRPLLDGGPKPSGVRIAVWLQPDGTLREIETTPVFKIVGEKHVR